ncbi:hypothetical protein CAPTEDRAFT_193792 [Capitella teleta]|uniref:Uncharacterized protein n=1 Tax=Capitella teleta TaxID=283909 RepID=R7V9Q1_CAPTE|nr:hypothetical protein CAPTEDRAFT_193792 [Capitella teleta]|eukprot:ELU15314.1 hypothetical protein CAPTEDRAFT_193792 [Capitella teleta]
MNHLTSGGLKHKDLSDNMSVFIMQSAECGVDAETFPQRGVWSLADSRRKKKRFTVGRELATLDEMSSLQHSVPSKLDTNANTENWHKREQEFHLYFTAREISKKLKAAQVAILLHVAGTDAQELHSALVFAEKEASGDYKTVLKKFREHYEP